MLPPIPLSNNYEHSVNEEQWELKTRSLIKANSQWHKAQLFRYFLWQPGYFNFCLNLQITFLLLLQNMPRSQFLSHFSNKTLRKIHGGKDCRLCILLQISFRSLGWPLPCASIHTHHDVIQLLQFGHSSFSSATCPLCYHWDAAQQALLIFAGATDKMNFINFLRFSYAIKKGFELCF